MNDIKQKVVRVFKKTKTLQLIAAFILFWIPVIVFSKIAGEIIEKEPIHLDIEILHFIHSLSSPVLDHIFLFITTLGNVEYILPLSILILGFLIYKKQKMHALIFFFGVGGAAAANVILKLLFHRERPAFWQSLITETGYSFPSGHAMASSALVLTLIVILWNTKWRIASMIIGGLFILLIGLSRLYMGVHYPTDIVAGWSVSLAWVLIVTAIGLGLRRKFSLRKNTSN